MVLVFIFGPSDVERLPMCLFAIGTASLVRRQCKSFTLFLLVCFLLIIEL